MALDTLLRKHFIRHHGEGAAHQADFYRCMSCGGLITWKKIRSNTLCCAGRLTKTNPTWWEAFRLLVFPWTL